LLKSSVSAPIQYLTKFSIKILAIFQCHTSIICRAQRGIKTSEDTLKTKSKKVAIGDRCKPNAAGKSGYIRINAVHPGDQDGKKGGYHINAVDEAMLSCRRINEQFLIPVLTEILEIFAFNSSGFHADNSSEYIKSSIFRTYAHQK